MAHPLGPIDSVYVEAALAPMNKSARGCRFFMYIVYFLDRSHSQKQNKKRSAKSDHYLPNSGNLCISKKAVFVDDQLMAMVTLIN